MGKRMIELNGEALCKGSFKVYDKIIVTDELIVDLQDHKYQLYFGIDIYKENVQEKLLTMFQQAVRGKDNRMLSFELGFIDDSNNSPCKVKAIRAFSEDDCINRVFVPTNRYKIMIEGIDNVVHAILFNLPSEIKFTTT